MGNALRMLVFLATIEYRFSLICVVYCGTEALKDKGIVAPEPQPAAIDAFELDAREPAGVIRNHFANDVDEADLNVATWVANHSVRSKYVASVYTNDAPPPLSPAWQSAHFGPTISSRSGAAQAAITSMSSSVMRLERVKSALVDR